LFVDARTIPHGSLAEADVCIVGAGAAGITIARELAARPLRVALLESGWLEPDAATQSLYAGEIVERPYFALDASRSRYFGGTTNDWSGECRPLDPIDFEARDWVPHSGWPFGREELEPFYERARSICQLEPADEVRPVALQGDRVCSHPLHLSPPTRFGAVYREQIAKASNVIAYLGANVVGLDTGDPPTTVRAVRVACLAGNRFLVNARVFVLATGGVENARLLLLSNDVQPAGLGNTHDQVGRYFMEHLYLDRAATIVARPGAIDDAYTLGRRTGGRRVRGILGLAPEVQRAEGLTNFSAVLDDESRRPRELVRTMLAALRRRRILASRADERHATPRERRYVVKNAMEQAPNPDSRVVLSCERDRLGSPRVSLRWALSPIDKRTMHRAHEILDEELRRAGVGRLHTAQGRVDDPWPERLRGARHHMGTTRMHPDPRHGVVDASCRVHGIANLFVAGSSVFPTAGSANPTLSIVALALRLAEHLPRVLRDR